MKIGTVEFMDTLMDAAAPLPGDLPQIAFSGRSNVGKSSLINTLLGRTKKGVAYVSRTPGKTQGLNFYRINGQFFFVDLPGFGFAKVPDHVREGWKPLIEGYLARSDGPCAVVHLMDARRNPTDDDLKMLDYLVELGLPALIGITKIDKLSWEKRMKTIPALIHSLDLDSDQVIPFSSKTGEGRDNFLRALTRFLDGQQQVPASNRVGSDA